jgi:hypothetical protein
MGTNERNLEPEQAVDMKLMIYASPFDKTAGKMVKHLCRRYRGSDTVYLPSLGEVEVYLRQPSYLGRLMVLMPKDGDDLNALVTLSHLMRDHRLILVLPEDEIRINAQSHMMRPRFVTYSDCDPSQLTLVVDRLMATDAAPPMKAAQ